MRALTKEELELIAGGDGTTVAPVPVTGTPPTPPWYPPTGWEAPPSYPPPPDCGGDSGGGSSGGGTGGSNSDGEDPEKNCAVDAQARAAYAQFQQAATAENKPMAYRERNAFIIRNEDGSYGLSGYTEGPPATDPGGPQVSLNTTGLTPTNTYGFVHNHPGGTTVPSGADVLDILRPYHDWIKNNGGTQEFRMYIISGDKIYVYDVDNAGGVTSTLEVSGAC